VLNFLKNVVKLDIAKYDATPVGTMVTYPEWLGGLAQITGKITLESKTSKLDVLFKFRNNTLSWCLVRVQEGSPQYTKTLSSNLRDVTGDFLQEYQTYTGDSKLEEMRNILDTVDVMKNATKKVGNLKLQVSVNSFSSSFNWRTTINGADYSGVDVSFRDGNFYSFSDDRSYYKIGGTTVNIGKEEAINIALKQAEDFWWTVGNVEVRDFNIMKDLIGAKLLTRSRDPLELYPYWMITLPLDGLYPGMVTTILVKIWADTAEVIDILALGYGGELPPESTTTNPLPEENVIIPPTENQADEPPTTQSIELSPAQKPSPILLAQEVDTAAPSTDILIAVAVATVIAIAIIAVAIKKKCK
jgi:hypothetical protein